MNVLDIMLPGRDSPCPDDYETQNALRTLLEAHKILKTADEALFERMRELIDYNQECLSRVEDTLAGGGGTDSLIFDATEDRGDTRTVDDFFNRLNRSRKEEHARNLTPIKGGKY